MRLAHSAPSDDRQPHPYRDHIRGAVDGARKAAEAVARHMAGPARAARFVRSVVDGTTFHDLGKLDADNQAALAQGRKGRMKWDHIDAGVAHLLQAGAGSSAWIVRAHHAPGLPARAEHFSRAKAGALGLRGRRHDDDPNDLQQAQIARTNETLTSMIAAHEAEAGKHEAAPGKTEHGLFLRLALSCLVDGDHADAASFETGWSPPLAPSPRWAERLAHLDDYVAGLGLRDGARQADRAEFYRACRTRAVDEAMVACEGPVGIGKTTAVLGWLLRRAMASGARRIFVVAPYTTILSQTAETLRAALLLPDEAGLADQVVAEHHHRADFHALASRDLAVLWQAPIVLTTGVQFFETLSACDPAALRKLHALPGSAVFLDEAHAALPAHLWRQNWAWMRELARDWGCSFVFASGSLARVWNEEDLVDADKTATLPDLAPPHLTARLNAAEHRRVRYRTEGRLGTLANVTSVVRDADGPRLVVLNTVQSAAMVAKRLREDGHETLHLSTALCPADRGHLLGQVKAWLHPDSGKQDWTLVATSLVEAGVDLSFRTAFRERFSASSLIQIGGRVNRHGGQLQAAEVTDFFLDRDEGLTLHPGARRSADVLGRLFAQNRFEQAFSPAELVTTALLEEVRDRHGQMGERLSKAEGDADYPRVAKDARLIDTDTQLVVVRRELKERLEAREHVSSRDLLGGSVQIWSNKVQHFGAVPLNSRPDLFWWPYPYDGQFLGYMEGALRFVSGEAFLV